MARIAAPAQLKVLQGRGPGLDGRERDSGGRPIDPPPPFRRIAPAKPEDLSALASAHWDEVLPELERLEMLTPSHVGSLVMLCELWAVYVEAMARVRAKGLVVRSAQGPLRNPAIGIALSAIKEYRSVAVQFGLTPSAESRLKPREADGGEADNPFA